MKDEWDQNEAKMMNREWGERNERRKISAQTKSKMGEKRIYMIILEKREENERTGIGKDRGNVKKERKL